MSALPRPDLPIGPQRDLVAALHDLHHRAGWPSLRALGRETGVSHTTVSKVFSAPGLPAWGTLELLVEALHGDTAQFHELWLRASGPDGRASRRARIAGRRTELTVVRRHLEAGVGLLLVSGEAGIGKTTLVEAATASAEVFVASRPLPPTRPPRCPSCRSWTHSAASWTATTDSGSRKPWRECPDYVGSTLAGLLPELDPDTGPLMQGNPSGRQRLFVSIASVLRSLASTGRLGLVVEDLHWADTGTLDFLEYLLSGPQRLAVMGTWRVDDVSTAVGTSTGSSGWHGQRR